MKRTLQKRVTKLETPTAAKPGSSPGKPAFGFIVAQPGESQEAAEARWRQEHREPGAYVFALVPLDADGEPIPG